MTIASVTAGDIIDPDWGNSVASTINTMHAVTGTASVTGIGSADVLLPDADATLPLISGQSYLVSMFVPIRFGASATSFLRGEVQANGTIICEFETYSTWISQQRFTLHAYNIFTAASSSASFNMRVSSSVGTMQTNATVRNAYGYSVIPIGS
jgi:hypothetical protein